MTRYWLGLPSAVIVLALACGPNAGGVGSGDGDSSGSGSGSGSETATSSMNPTVTATTNGSADGTGSTGSTGVVDGSSTSVTTDPGTTDPGTTTGATDGGSSSGGPPPDSYPGCMVDEDCSDPYNLCWPPPEFGTPNFCTLECVDAGDCPEASSGGATPVCEGPPGTDICVLDCSMGDCPDGMDCVDIFGNGAFLRCVRL